MASLRIRRRPPASRRSVPLAPLAMRILLGSGALLGLGGCSGTPFGDQLARSFSAAPATAPASPAAPSSSGGTAPQAPSPQRPAASPATPTGTTATTGAVRTGSGPRQVAQPAARQAPPAPTAAAPYRVTIRLPAADPSAPAERVTEALRAAGVPFEVETIERMGASGAADGPAAPLVPQRTPAPAPR